MGGVSFYTYGFGDGPGVAYADAQERAEDRVGHQEGYSGDVNSNRGGYVVIPEEEHKGKQKREYANLLMAQRDERVDSKWGTCGAINVSGTKEARRFRDRNGLKGKQGDVWLFFGIAPC